MKIARLNSVYFVEALVKGAFHTESTLEQLIATTVMAQGRYANPGQVHLRTVMVMTEAKPPEEVLDLAVRAKAVWLVLDFEDDALSTMELSRKSGLTPRQVRHGLQDLRDAGVVERRTSLDDARTYLYELSDSPDD